MARRKVRVINRGKRIRDRLGSRFLPNQPQELEVNSRQYLTLKAVKDFTVEIINEDKKKDDNNNIKSNVDINNKVVTKDEDNEKNGFGDELDYYDLNIEEVLKAVEEGIFDVDEAIAYEVAGKNRVTLLNKLEELKKQGG